MKNQALKNDLNKIIQDKADLNITKGELSGASIDIHNTKTDTEFGRYTYYERENQRNTDFENLNKLTA